MFIIVLAARAPRCRRPLNLHVRPHKPKSVPVHSLKPTEPPVVTTSKEQLLDQLASVEGVSAEPSPVAGGTALFFRGKEFAHFHNDNELDLRLTRKVITSLGLSHPPGSVHHPTRAASSPWIEIRFSSPGEVKRTVELVMLAVAQL